jgi:hypothetical protein
MGLLPRRFYSLDRLPDQRRDCAIVFARLCVLPARNAEKKLEI